MPLVSIIVPIYNVEKYLRRCIDSILNQTFKDFELILVNDGSTDNCEDICKGYEAKDKRIKYFYQNNSGVSVARNKGIENSCGKYIQFIDSDDYIDKNFLEVIVDRFNKDNSDIVFIGFYNEYNNGEIYKEKYYDTSITSNSIQEYCLKLYKSDLFGYTCCKTFKSSIVKKFNIRFNVKMNYCEDELFTCDYCNHIKRMSIENRTLYHYIDYQGNRNTLSKKDKDEIFNRDKLFNGWLNLLGDYDKEYLDDKAYKTIKFLYLKEVWAEYPYKVRKNNINKIKETSIMNYIDNSKNLRKEEMISCIKYIDIRLFKLFSRVCSKFKIVL